MSWADAYTSRGIALNFRRVKLGHYCGSEECVTAIFCLAYIPLGPGILQIKSAHAVWLRACWPKGARYRQEDSSHAKAGEYGASAEIGSDHAWFSQRHIPTPWGVLSPTQVCHEEVSLPGPSGSNSGRKSHCGPFTVTMTFRVFP